MKIKDLFGDIRGRFSFSCRLPAANVTAMEMQSHCKQIAEPLQSGCSTTAKGLQHHCKTVAFFCSTYQLIQKQLYQKERYVIFALTSSAACA